MSLIKSRVVQEGVREAGAVLASVFHEVDISSFIGNSTFDIDLHIKKLLDKKQLISQAYGYHGYPCYTCISIDDVVVHGVPAKEKLLQHGDVVTLDICASYKGFCADMARTYIIGSKGSDNCIKKTALIKCAEKSLNYGIQAAKVNNFLGDIGYAISQHIQESGYGVVRDFCGHGIGRTMHEKPEVPNYGMPGCGIKLRHGMIFAIEPMLTIGSGDIRVDSDGWTARSKEGGLAVHVEDTVIITDNGPEIVTR